MFLLSESNLEYVGSIIEAPPGIARALNRHRRGSQLNINDSISLLAFMDLSCRKLSVLIL